jgi:N-acetylglucosaminyl-diphospho-decaprenol L-rhamnosyltransferase
MEASGTGVPAAATGGIGADDRAPDVSVVVLGYNGLRYVDACLDALGAQVAETPPFEVVFFDNASTDGTPDRVAAVHPWVRLVRNPTNLGFAAGNVAALGEVRGRWVVFLNQDTVVGTGFVSGLLSAAAESGAAAVQASMVLPWQPCAAGFDPAVAHDHVHVAELTRAAYVAYAIADPQKWLPTLFVSGAAFLIDTHVLPGIGGLFDPDFWAYCEDTDLALRLRSADHRVIVAGDALVFHDLTPATDLSRASVLKTIRILRNRHLACARSMRAGEYLRVAPRLIAGAAGKTSELPTQGRLRPLLGPAMVGLSVVGMAWALASMGRHRATRRAVLAARVGGPSAIADALDEADLRVRRLRAAD